MQCYLSIDFYTFCYETQTIDFYFSQGYCTNFYQSSLASVFSETENTSLRDLLRSIQPPSIEDEDLNTWFGLYDNGSNSQREWIWLETMEKVSAGTGFTHWQDGQPNCCDDCVYFKRTSKWNDWSCSNNDFVHCLSCDSPLKFYNDTYLRSRSDYEYSIFNVTIILAAKNRYSESTGSFNIGIIGDRYDSQYPSETLLNYDALDTEAYWFEYRGFYDPNTTYTIYPKIPHYIGNISKLIMVPNGTTDSARLDKIIVDGIESSYLDGYQVEIKDSGNCDGIIIGLNENVYWTFSQGGSICPFTNYNNSQTVYLQPSLAPSTMPSTLPSGDPTSQPTMIPSGTPSDKPTAQPTVSPTIDSTMTPSNSPTGIPSWFPTRLPTTEPTTAPTITPSVFPTSIPTEIPNDFPSTYPTTSPIVFTTQSSEQSANVVTHVSTWSDTNRSNNYSIDTSGFNTDDGVIGGDSSSNTGDSLTFFGVSGKEFLIIVALCIFVFCACCVWCFAGTVLCCQKTQLDSITDSVDELIKIAQVTNETAEQLGLTPHVLAQKNDGNRNHNGNRKKRKKKGNNRIKLMRVHTSEFHSQSGNIDTNINININDDRMNGGGINIKKNKIKNNNSNSNINAFSSEGDHGYDMNEISDYNSNQLLSSSHLIQDVLAIENFNTYNNSKNKHECVNSTSTSMKKGINFTTLGVEKMIANMELVPSATNSGFVSEADVDIVNNTDSDSESESKSNDGEDDGSVVQLRIEVDKEKKNLNTNVNKVTSGAGDLSEGSPLTMC